MSCTKKGFSTNELQKQLGLKRYEPVWAMVHKLRKAMGNRDARYTLEGVIEQDEGYFSVASKEIEGGQGYTRPGSRGQTERCGDGRKHAVGRYRNGQKGEACALFQGQGAG